MSASTVQTFDITIDGTYTAHEVPPRCRKPRPVEYPTSAVVTVPVVDDAAAPVAFEVREAIGGDRQVRTWDGNLYGPYRPFSRQTETSIAGDEHFPAERSAEWHITRDASTAEEFADLVTEQYAHFLIVDVDGRLEVWAPCGEPRYVVMTFGMSHNGSTGLMTSGSDNSNLKASAYFRADDFESARTYALRVATNRGDLRSVPGLETQEPDITVLIPDAVTLVVPDAEPEEVEQARTALTAAARNYARIMDYSTEHSAQTEAAAWGILTDARKTLRALTKDLTGTNAERRPYEDR